MDWYAILNNNNNYYYYTIEWRRVLKPGGMLMIAVPDMETIARMYLNTSFTGEQHWMVTRMFYGGQTDEYDYHMVGIRDIYILSLHTCCFQ